MKCLVPDIWRGLIAFLFLGLVICISEATAAEKVRLQLRFDHQFQFAGYYAAKWQGYYEEAGIDVEILSGVRSDGSMLCSPEIVGEGDADFGIGSGDILLAIDRGIDLVILASIFQKSPVEIFSMQDTGLSSPADLARLKVYGGQSPLVDAEVMAMLRAEGIDPGKVDFTVPREHLTVPAFIESLFTGEVDAILGYGLSVPWYAGERGISLTRMRPSVYGVDFYGDTLFTHRHLIEEKPEMVEKFVAASIKGWSFALENSDEINYRIINELPRTLYVKDPWAYNKFLSKEVRDLMLYPIVDIGNINSSRWLKMHESLSAAGLVKQPLNVEQIVFDPEKIRSIKKTRLLILVLALLGSFFLISVMIIVRIRLKQRAERRKSENELLKQNNAAQKYLDIAGVMIVALDVSRKVTLINKKGCEILEYKEENIIGTDWFDNYLPERLREEVKTVFDKLMAGEIEPVEYYENPVLTKNGEEKIIAWHNIVLSDETGKVIGTLSSGENITESKQAETALRLSEEKFSKAFRSSPTLISITTLEEDRFIDVNDAYIAISGYSQEEIIGHYSKKLNLWADPSEREKIIKQLKEHSVVYNKEIGFRVKSGDVLTVLFSAEMIHMDGEPCILAVALDITERKKLESQLLHAQKLEAVGQLAGGVAHDFNNILSAIISYCYLTKMKLKEGDRLRENIDKILSLSDRAAEITRGLLAFSRKQPFEPLPVNFNSLIRDVQKLLVKFIGEEIEVRIKLTDEEPVIMADRSQMEQVIMNLVTNARDAMPNRGILTIETELQEIDDSFIDAHGFGEQGRYILLTVSDTGTGMDEQTRQKIFEPFFTTKEVGKGTGLGLSIIYGIINEHNGHINVYSEPGKGSTYKIYLPIIEAEIAEDGKQDIFSVPRGKGETILVAEDEPSVMDAMKTILEGAGYKVIEAVDGKDAVEKFKEHKDRVDLLMLDVIMPEMNGKEAYEKIKKASPELKVIFTSGYTADIIQSKGIMEDNMIFISKPISPENLLLKIREVIGNE